MMGCSPADYAPILGCCGGLRARRGVKSGGQLRTTEPPPPCRHDTPLALLAADNAYSSAGGALAFRLMRRYCRRRPRQRADDFASAMTRNMMPPKMRPSGRLRAAELMSRRGRRCRRAITTGMRRRCRNETARRDLSSAQLGFASLSGGASPMVLARCFKEAYDCRCFRDAATGFGELIHATTFRLSTATPSYCRHDAHAMIRQFMARYFDALFRQCRWAAALLIIAH